MKFFIKNLFKRESIIVITVTTIIAVFFFLGIFEPLEIKTLDFRFRQRKNLKPNPKIVVISISDDCLSTLGQWPWSRKKHAELIDILTKDGVNSIGFDLLFLYPTDPESDAALSLAIKTAKNVITAVMFTYQQVFDGEIKTVLSVEEGLDEIKKYVYGQGYINVDFERINTDGIVRKVDIFRTCDNKKYLSLPLALAAKFLKIKDNNIKYNDSSMTFGKIDIPLYTTRYLKKSSKSFNFLGYDLNIPELIEKNIYIVNYPGPTSSGLFENYQFSSVYSKDFINGAFKDKIVIIGSSASVLQDIKLTPFQLMPGVEIHASIIKNILENNFLHRTSSITIIVFMFIFGLFLAFMLSISDPGLKDLIFMITLPVIYVIIGQFIFNNFSLIIEIVPFITLFIISYVLVRFYQMFIKLLLTNIALSTSNRSLDRKVREITALYETSNCLNVTMEMDSIFEIVLSKTLTILECERASIMLLNEDTNLLETSFVIGNHSNSDTIQLQLGEGIAGKVVSDCEAYFTNEGADDSDFKSIKLNREKNINSILCVPLVIKNKATGVINLVNSQKGFSSDDLNLMQTIANQVAMTIQNAKLYKLAVFDGLTELYVRRYFDARLNQEFGRVQRYGGELSLIMTDIDHFKNFNDTYGHQIGDLVLSGVAKIVHDSARETDLPARYGGEEFAIILPETDQEGAMILAERIRKRIEDTTKYGANELSVTISLGVSSFNCETPATSFEEMIKQADLALYKAKDTGRNKTVLFTSSPL
ncbi:diguanylate cyclase [bacterium]|nr:diguanylate cyclase [bacterium]